MTDTLWKAHRPLGEPNPTNNAVRLTREALAVIDDKWVPHVLMELSTGARRNRELLASIPGIQESMLTRTLRAMERNGLVAREVRASVPAQCWYVLTDLGRSLDEPLHALAAWAEDRLPEVQAVRVQYDSAAIVGRAYS